MRDNGKPVFEVIRECPHTRARAGLLHTPHGTVETPVFMPVGTQGSVKGLPHKMLAEDLGARIILSNTYHLFLRPGHETIERLGGLHKFMSWPGAILTDSGGFQVFSLSNLRKVTEEGVVFRSHLDGTELRFTPESVVEVQRALGSDVAMVLDECTEFPVSHERARSSMGQSLQWAERAFAYWRAQHSRRGGCSASPSGPGLLFPIVQGSTYPDLRQECAERLLQLDAPGYAIGGLSVGEPRPASYEMTDLVTARLPQARPRYVMGVGMLHELAEYVALGVDMMDCVLPTRNARNGYLFTSSGPLIIKHARWAEDPSPVDSDCLCHTCLHYSRAYLRHLCLAKEVVYNTLATIHNVWMYLDTMRRIREAILLGEYRNFLASARSAAQSETRDSRP